MRKIYRFLVSKIRARKLRRRNRSITGDIGLTLMLAFFGLFSVFPLVLLISSAFKPLSEIFIFPPKLTVENPTLNNFLDLATIIESFNVPLTRYIFNTTLITGLGTLLTVLLGSMAAFPLAKYTFPGSKLMSNIILYSLMFNASVAAIPNYLIMNYLGLIDSYWAVVLPVVGSTLGLYLMKNFMVQIPDEMLEAAKIDGAGELKTFWRVVMPLCKPAWITLIILSFQNLWGSTGGVFVYTEELKPVSYVLVQMVSGGISRMGVSSAITFIMILVPITVFIISQSNVIETMATSGVKG